MQSCISVFVLPAVSLGPPAIRARGTLTRSLHLLETADCSWAAGWLDEQAITPFGPWGECSIWTRWTWVSSMPLTSHRLRLYLLHFDSSLEISRWACETNSSDYPGEVGGSKGSPVSTLNLYCCRQFPRTAPYIEKKGRGWESLSCGLFLDLLILQVMLLGPS